MAVSGAISTLPGFRGVTQRLCTVLAIATLHAACVKQLPPAPTPAPVAPQVQAAGPPPNGYGRIVIDVTDGPTPVQRIHMQPNQRSDGRRTTFHFVQRPETLCAATPCAADVPAGNMILGFPVLGDSGATEVELVHVGLQPEVYRRTLSVYTDNTGGTRLFGILATIFGGMAAATGVVLLPIGLAKEHTGLTTAGGISLGAGALLLAVGIWAINADAPTYRPGSSNHFPL